MRFFWARLKTTPGMNPPPSIRTFFQVYGSAAAAVAVLGREMTVAMLAITRAAIAVPTFRRLISRRPFIDRHRSWERSHLRSHESECSSFFCQVPETTGRPPRGIRMGAQRRRPPGSRADCGADRGAGQARLPKLPALLEAGRVA